MEKISKVVPSSAKFDIDVSKERPMRSGAPNFGLPIAKSTSDIKREMEMDRLKSQAMASNFETESLQKVNNDLDVVDKVNVNFKKVAPEMNQTEKLPLILVLEDSINNGESESGQGLSVYV